MRSTRVAVLALDDPWGPPDGGRLRIVAFTEAFRRCGHDVEVIFPREDEEERGELYLGQRMPAWIGALKRKFVPLPTKLGAGSAAIERRLVAFDPEVLFVSHTSLARYAAAVPGAHLWLDFSDLWSLFAEREAKSRRGLARKTSSLQATALRKQEVRLASRASVVTAAGWNDAETLSLSAGISVPFLPNPIDVQATSQAPLDARAAGFIGNLAFWPNRDAVDFLLTEWWPRLEANGWSLVIAGAGSDELSLPTGVKAMGPVRSVGDFYSSISLALAPIRLGGGLKVKVVEALRHGLSVVATREAVEGLDPASRSLVRVVEGEPSFDWPTPERADNSAALEKYTQESFEMTVVTLLQRIECRHE